MVYLCTVLTHTSTSVRVRVKASLVHRIWSTGVRIEPQGFLVECIKFYRVGRRLWHSHIMDEICHGSDSKRPPAESKEIYLIIAGCSLICSMSYVSL